MASKNGKRRNGTAIETRRYQYLDMRVAGATYRQIAERMNTSKSVVHREVRKALSELADEYSSEADNLRAMQMSRYNQLLLRWFPQALKGSRDALESVLRIMTNMNKINGLEQTIAFQQNIKEFTFNIERTDINDDSADNIPTTFSLPQTTDGDIQSQ
tara:strand:- start:495 stop:968 length:474 start_codon:yes stop_codon:yes gene_type:complete